MNEVKLLSFSKGSGCSCKIEPKKLKEILGNLPIQPIFSEVLVGNQNFDDASVIQLSPDLALVSSVDFFTPLVNNAFEFGKIAAANALSDIYAMGAKPIIATAILGWPVEQLSLELASEVIRGAQEVCNSIGISIAGGHSIDITEPIFGLHVNGTVHPDKIIRNDTAEVGDLIVLTKSLGTGMLSVALKKEVLSQEFENDLIDSCSKLNSIGFELGSEGWVTAMTDVTGFSLMGHLSEMCSEELSADIYLQSIPKLKGVDWCIIQNIQTGSTYRNFNEYGSKVLGITGQEFLYLFDPQTNGGLLFSIHPQKYQEMLLSFKSRGIDISIFHPIGTFKNDSKNEIQILHSAFSDSHA